MARQAFNSKLSSVWEQVRRSEAMQKFGSKLSVRSKLGVQNLFRRSGARQAFGSKASVWEERIRRSGANQAFDSKLYGVREQVRRS